MKNTPLSSKDFHKCDVCNGKLHGFLCCVTGTFDEDTGKGKCKTCDEIATAATNKTRSSTRKKTHPKETWYTNPYVLQPRSRCDTQTPTKRSCILPVTRRYFALNYGTWKS